MKSWKKLEKKLGKSWEKFGEKLGTSWEHVGNKLKFFFKKFKKVEKKLKKSWKKVGKKIKIPEYVKDPKQECSWSKSKLVWKVDIS